MLVVTNVRIYRESEMAARWTCWFPRPLITDAHIPCRQCLLCCKMSFLGHETQILQEQNWSLDADIDWHLGYYLGRQIFNSLAVCYCSRSVCAWLKLWSIPLSLWLMLKLPCHCLPLIRFRFYGVWSERGPFSVENRKTHYSSLVESFWRQRDFTKEVWHNCNRTSTDLSNQFSPKRLVTEYGIKSLRWNGTTDKVK